jgi:hypothetical protein
VRRAAGLTIVIALLAGGAGSAGAQGMSALLQGTFAMRGRLTTAVGVFGEHLGQRVRRSWTFVPGCQKVDCQHVMLTRQRSGRHIPDVVALSLKSPGLYVGHSRFWIALRCAGQVVTHGGLVAEKITVRITATATQGTTPVATAISATYRNPWRKNLTQCPGGLGHDAARYHGQLAS